MFMHLGCASFFVFQIVLSGIDKLVPLCTYTRISNLWCIVV